ncbi:MAG: ADP-glyceromanno-heptose 6-epimerase [Crocinitomicaceae bacterium]|nr:ADP-glyceromanno-heptose 6-epimerase [Crocinitomicaceae bacterium]
MIVITGAAGFISSCLVEELNQRGREDLIIVDDFSKTEKERNFLKKKYQHKVERGEFFDWLENENPAIDIIYHLGARTDTTEFDKSIFDELNEAYSQRIWNYCVKNNIPLIYASSAATYGLGELGYADSHDIINDLKPLNPYGESKNNFDIWALAQENKPPYWAGLKFFNVYGPNEYHKGRMASVIMHAFNQIKANGGVKLFRSHNSEYKDGEQLRDFIYVKDLVNVCLFLGEKQRTPGLYNLGTGEARTFLDLAKATFTALNLEANISFIDTPEDIRDKYQYYTKAEMGKLLAEGYSDGFKTLEEGVKDYVQNYLVEQKIF